jgi:peptide deformylase
MKEVAKLAHGIGLAAPQVGVSARVIIASIGESRMTTLINPRILRSDGAVWGEEGCLSIPGLYGDVERAIVVEVEAMDIEGKPVKYLLEGMAARVVQHEIDHLDGVLFIDKVDLESLHWAWPAGAAAS